MEPVDVQVIGPELAIKWNTGVETYVTLKRLRRHCPCAGCAGEKDILGNVYKAPDRPLAPAAFKLIKVERVGGYALQPVWGDGHSSGIFTYAYLQEVAELAERDE